MKFLVLIHQTKPISDFSLSDEELQEVRRRYEHIRDLPGVTHGGGLEPAESAKTIRLRGGKPFTTDGPFAETKDAIGGFFMVEAGSLDEALEVAALVPALRFEGAVEVRPIRD